MCHCLLILMKKQIKWFQLTAHKPSIQTPDSWFSPLCTQWQNKQNSWSQYVLGVPHHSISPFFKTCLPTPTTEEVDQEVMFIPHGTSPGHRWLAQDWTPDLRSVHPLAGQEPIAFKDQILNSENHNHCKLVVVITTGKSYRVSSDKPTTGGQAAVMSE